jgi:hypothetical protein
LVYFSIIDATILNSLKTWGDKPVCPTLSMLHDKTIKSDENLFEPYVFDSYLMMTQI